MFDISFIKKEIFTAAAPFERYDRLAFKAIITIKVKAGVMTERENNVGAAYCP
jgi:hypothetical protein